MLEFLHRANVDVISEVSEHRRTDPPLLLLNTLFNKRKFSSLYCLLCGVRVDYLVEAGKYVAPSDILKGHACLNKQTPFRNFHCFLLPFSCPHRKSRVARLAMYGHKTDVIMPSSKNCTNIVFLQVTASRSKKMCASLHSFGEGIFRYSHPDCSHFSDDLNRVEHFESPAVHLGLPVREIFGNDLREVVGSSLGSFSNFPHVAPLSIKNRDNWGYHSIFGGLCKILYFFGVIPGHVNVFWCRSSLIVELWLYVIHLFARVEQLSGLFKVVFHEVDIVLVVLKVDSWVLD
jgi:hypothetical protein